MKQFLLFLFLVNGMVSAQIYHYASNNGFSGTFEMQNGVLKANSVVIEKFKTSVGVFAENDLEAEGIIFPYPCGGCSFEINADGNPFKVKNTTGIGFSRAVKAAKEHVQKKQEHEAIKRLISELKGKSTVQEQLQLTYASYANFAQKSLIDDLLVRIRQGDFIEDGATNYDANSTIRKKGKSTVLSEEVDLEPESAIENSRGAVIPKRSKTNEEVKNSNKARTFDQKELNGEPNKNEVEGADNSKAQQNSKSGKCLKNIRKLETRLKKAKAENDYVIIREIEQELKRKSKKCR